MSKPSDNMYCLHVLYIHSIQAKCVQKNKRQRVKTGVMQKCPQIKINVASTCTHTPTYTHSHTPTLTHTHTHTHSHTSPPHVTLSGMSPSCLRIGPFIRADRSSCCRRSTCRILALSSHPKLRPLVDFTASSSGALCSRIL